MGKKGDKAAKDKVSAINIEDEAKSAEDYQCTGNLEVDFTELCNRIGLTEIPRVTLVEHMHHYLDKSARDETDVASEKDSQASGSIVWDKFTYFKPSLQIRLESEDAKSARDIFIRGWKIDEKIMGVLKRCLPTLSNLQDIYLWNVGLTGNTLAMLISFLPLCTHLRTLVLDGNSSEKLPYHKLIGDDPTITNLVLRNNKIDDEAASLIGETLSNVKITNKALVSLNLSYNHIGDKGAGSIAEGLRRNRTLLWLDLSHNQIQDEGALKLAEILGVFPLTHKETVERRQLLLAKDVRTGGSKYSEMKMDRPQSHHSVGGTEKGEKTVPLKAGKSASKKKDKDKETTKKEERGSVGMSGGTSAHGGPAKKEDMKTAKKQVANPEQKAVKGRGAKSATKEKRTHAPESESTEPTELLNPLLETAEHRDGQVFMPGNKVLMSLNLARNQITGKSLKAFLTVLENQIQDTKLIPGTTHHTGLLRLLISKNDFDPENETFQKIQKLMLPRDPMQGSFLKNTEEEAATAT
ncbi:leucine-rich repeat-containing protein 71 isoform X1 [Ambystoma mexicanum]|uniref:leucine-rich repeat-containing protein 71 isoform X1 n=1 Tax=Ambystoma mexicanum TaxID=8296 RepID=UPI0037E82874